MCFTSSIILFNNNRDNSLDRLYSDPLGKTIIRFKGRDKKKLSYWTTEAVNNAVIKQHPAFLEWGIFDSLDVDESLFSPLAQLELGI